MNVHEIVANFGNCARRNYTESN